MTKIARWGTGILAAVILMTISGSLTISAIVKRQAFCAPAAQLAGLLSGAPCVTSGEDYRLIGSGLDLTVAPACAAVDYFCLMTGFLSLLMTWRGFRIRAQFLVLPLAWLLTIAVNAMRLTACWQADRIAQTFLPQPVWTATHMAVGIVTFLVGLTLVFWLMTWSGTKHGEERHHESGKQ